MSSLLPGIRVPSTCAPRGLVFGLLITTGLAGCNTEPKSALPAPDAPSAKPGVVVGDLRPATAEIRSELKGVFSMETQQGPGPTQKGQVTNLNGRSGDAGSPPATTTNEVV